jgi:hypothetical protein
LSPTLAAGKVYQSPIPEQPAELVRWGIPVPDCLGAFHMSKFIGNILHIVIAALAGTGKTTVLVQLIREFNQIQGLSVLALCFATRDKKALEGRAKGKAKVFTSNGGGLSILGSWARSTGKRIDVNTGVASQLLEQRLREDGLIKAGADGKDVWEIGGHIYGNILQLQSKVRTCLALRFNMAGYASQPTDADIMELADRFGVEIGNDDLPTVLFYVKFLFQELASLKNAVAYGVDQDGMVFLPAYHQLKPKDLFDRVLVDEAQDQSDVNRAIAVLFLKPNGRLVIVGDPNQGIYEWRGADEDSMPQWCQIMANRGGYKVFPLTLCRRCSKAVIKLAQGIVEGIQALPDAPDGSATDIADMNALVDHLAEKKTGLVLCRANAPMISLVLKLLALRIPAALMRSDIVAGLLKLVDQVSEGKSTAPITDCLVGLEQWEMDQLAKFSKRRDATTKCQLVRDKAACIRALAEEESVKTAADLRRKIDEIFPANVVIDPNTMIVGSTVHGAKGGEAKSVYLLSPDGAKSNIFDQVWSSDRDRDNTLYVGITRCELDIYFVGGRPQLRRFSSPIDLSFAAAE